MTSAKAGQRLEHVIFSGVALILVVYALLGFWQSYFSAGLFFATLPSLLVHVHAILFVGWIALFAVQNTLVALGNLKIHRQLGAIMAVLAVGLIIVGPVTVIMAVRRHAVGAGAFAGDLVQTIAFAILISAGLIARRRGPTHKRLMTLGSAAIIGPAIIRWPFDFIQQGPPFGVIFFYLLPALILVGYDLATRRRVYRATWFGLGLMVAVLLSFLVLPAWPQWIIFTSWVQQV